MLKRIIYFLKNRVRRVYMYYKYFYSSMQELTSSYDFENRTIWFIGSAHYNNIGDLAISEATVKFIEKNFDKYNLIEIRLCDYYKYLKTIKKLIKKDDIIVMQGGGNMGFMYFEAEINRRSVIKNFKNNKIIIFPSTIDYKETPRDQLELKKSIKIYNNHKNLIICAREQKSYLKMKKIYNNVILIPDIVLSLNFIKFNIKREKCIVCLRNDNEKTELSKKINYYLRENNNFVFTDNVAKEKNISIQLRKKIFLDKLKEYASAEIVITDRLHTMIFCTITETPCLFLDNANGKVSGVFEAYIKEKCNYIRILNEQDDIKQQINMLKKIHVRHEENFDEHFKELIDKV